MRPPRSLVLLMLALVAGAAQAAPRNVFVSAMTPSQELANPSIGTVPPSCLATFELFGAGGNMLRYRIRCYHITGVTAAHIHAPASADSNASPVVTLFTHAGTGNVN